MARFPTPPGSKPNTPRWGWWWETRSGGRSVRNSNKLFPPGRRRNAPENVAIVALPERSRGYLIDRPGRLQQSADLGGQRGAPQEQSRRRVSIESNEQHIWEAILGARLNMGLARGQALDLRGVDHAGERPAASAIPGLAPVQTDQDQRVDSEIARISGGHPGGTSRPPTAELGAGEGQRNPRTAAPPETMQSEMSSGSKSGRGTVWPEDYYQTYAGKSARA